MRKATIQIGFVVSFPTSHKIEHNHHIKVNDLVCKTTIVRVSNLLLLVNCVGVFCVLIHRVSAVVFGKKFFDFPVVLFGADGEFEIFSSDGVPVL
jgi:hypothetical protein